MANEKFGSTFIGDNFGWADVALVTGSFQNIGEYEVPAGEEISIGEGIYDDQERATGRIYFKAIDDAAAELKGTLRISAYSPQDRNLKILYEGRTERTSASTTRNLMQPLKEHPIALTKDQKLVLEFKPDRADTIDVSASSLILDVTKYIV